MSDAQSQDTKNCSGCTGMAWWATLLVAVLAVPSFGVVIAFTTPTASAAFQVIAFILACWLCTYLGMKLMSDPKMSKKIDLKK